MNREEEKRERIHEDKKRHHAEDEIRHEWKAEQNREYHEIKSEKAPIEERIANEERSERRQEHEIANDLVEEANETLPGGEE